MDRINRRRFLRALSAGGAVYALGRTPGTVWANLSLDGTTLTLHVLDLNDEAGWITTIKERYEKLLMEIFE